MKKQTKVLLAAAALTLGASFSVMAAEKGTWVLENDGWYCYDEDGDAYTEEFCLSYGTEYYMDEEGLLASSTWVDDYDEHIYYIQSDGSKTKNSWKLLVPHDDEDAEAEWYWFDNKGRMVSNKRVQIGENYYYFDETGKMLTGFVHYEKDVEVSAADESDTDSSLIVYAAETGERVENTWVDAVHWTEDADEAEEEDYNYFYIGSTGKVTTGKKDIEGLTYFFGTDGKMLTNWVGYDGTNYEEAADDITGYTNVYFVGDKESGYAKKNGWRKLADADDYNAETEEPDTYWYYFDKSGRAFLPKEATASVTKMKFAKNESIVEDGSQVIAAKEIDKVDYIFTVDGKLTTGLKKDAEGNMFYYTADGLVTGETTIKDKYDEEPFEFYFATKNTEELVKGQAVTGNVSGYLYINGQLIKAEEKGIYRLVENVIGEADFIVNQYGKIQHKADKEYELEDGSKITVEAFEDTDGLTEYSFNK